MVLISKFSLKLRQNAFLQVEKQIKSLTLLYPLKIFGKTRRNKIDELKFLLFLNILLITHLFIVIHFEILNSKKLVNFHFAN